MLQDIVIDTPLCSLSTLGITDPIHTTERFLPKLLVDLKIFSSITQVRKNRLYIVVGQ